VARHIASHAVTVTARDTARHASRHIRPSLEGGVNVTLGRAGGKEGERIDLFLATCEGNVDIKRRPDRTRARTIASFAASPVDSFAVLACSQTAASDQTHQRTPQRVPSVRNYPRRFPAITSNTVQRRNAVRYQRLVSSRRAKTLCWGHIGKGMRARRASTPSTLVDAAIAAPMVILPLQKTGHPMPVGKIWRSFRKVISLANFAAAFPRALGVPPQRSCTADGDLRR
jgi:hypothetical protein